ncbi:hypothetical protein Tco_0091786 [Tanacetum coccineum]
MVAFLKKPEGSAGFHQIVDFLNSTHIKYALTENPTIYVSLIHQFWQTASASTSENREMEITATIDGRVKTVTEASIRRHLKLEDSDGISTLPNTEIFEQLALMRYVSNSDRLTFQKGHFSPQWRFLIHTILHCLSAKKTAWDQFSSNIATAIICLATNRTFNFSKLIFDGMVKNLDNQSKFLMYPRFIQIFLNKHKRQLLPHKRTYIAPTLTQKLFGNMRRISKGYNGVDIPLFPTMLVQGLIFQGEGSTVPVESHHTPTDAPSTSPPHISPTLRSPIRQETKVPQLSSPPHTNVADEAASTGVDVRHGGAATTVTSLDAGQGSGNINKTPSMPHDSPLPRGHTLGSDEGRMQQNELMDLVTKLLIKKVKKLEQTVKTSQARRRSRVVISDDEEEDLEDSSKQGRMIEEIDQDAGVTLVTPTHSQEDQPEDQLGVFSAAKVLADAAKNVHTYTRRRRAVSTGSGGVSTASRLFSTTEESVSTAGASMPVSTGGMVQEVNKDKGKGIMTESEPEQTKTKMQQRQERAGYEAAVRLQEQLDEEERQRIARVHEEASSFNIEEWEDIQATIEADEELAQRIQAEEREKYSESKKARLFAELINQRKRYFAQQRDEEKRNKPLTQAQQRTYMSNYIKNMGSHTLQQLMRLSFDEIKALFETTMRRVQTFHPIESEGDKTVPELTTGSSKRGAEVELDHEGSKKQKTNEASEAYQTFNDMLKKFDRDDPDNLWSLVKERFSSTDPTDDKERTLWVKLKRLFESDTDDILWKLQRYMYDPLTWRLYDTCGVHHVSTDKGHDIFMLVEKDYPLTRGLLTLMLCNKLQVDQYSEMAYELLRKIVILANRPRQYSVWKRPLNTEG